MICRRDGQTEVLSVKISSVEEDLKWNWRWRALMYLFNNWKTEIIDECIIIHSDGFFINKNMYFHLKNFQLHFQLYTKSIGDLLFGKVFRFVTYSFRYFAFNLPSRSSLNISILVVHRLRLSNCIWILSFTLNYCQRKFLKIKKNIRGEPWDSTKRHRKMSLSRDGICMWFWVSTKFEPSRFLNFSPRNINHVSKLWVSTLFLVRKPWVSTKFEEKLSSRQKWFEFCANSGFSD